MDESDPVGGKRERKRKIVGKTGGVSSVETRETRSRRTRSASRARAKTLSARATADLICQATMITMFLVVALLAGDPIY